MSQHQELYAKPENDKLEQVIAYIYVRSLVSNNGDKLHKRHTKDQDASESTVEKVEISQHFNQNESNCVWYNSRLSVQCETLE